MSLESHCCHSKRESGDLDGMAGERVCSDACSPSACRAEKPGRPPACLSVHSFTQQTSLALGPNPRTLGLARREALGGGRQVTVTGWSAGAMVVSLPRGWRGSAGRDPGTT